MARDLITAGFSYFGHGYNYDATGANADPDSLPVAVAYRNNAKITAGFTLTVASSASTFGRFGISGTVPTYTSGDAIDIALRAINSAIESEATVDKFTFSSGGAGGDATQAKQDTIIANQAAMQGAGFATGTDSLEAIRDRGDIAWITGAGGDATEAKQDLILADTANIDAAVAALNDISASDVWAQVIELGYDASDLLKLTAAALAGTLEITNNGNDTSTFIFKDVTGVADRITAIVNTSGERTAVSLDVS